MKVSEALRRIGFKIGTLDDVSGRAVNPIINNRIIVDELNSQLRQYSNITKGIQDVYTAVVNTNTPFIDAPPLALRSEAYLYALSIFQGTMFPMDIRGAADVLPRFRYNPMMGITNWLMPYQTEVNGVVKQYLGVYPMRSASAHSTTLNGNVLATDTTITVVSTSGYMNNSGRISIENEKIMYTYKDNTNFYGCVRGIEGTTGANHATSTTVYENNIWLFYSRLPETIVVLDDNIVETSVLNLDIPVAEEHMEGIIKLVAYNLLIKLDPTRAAVYKMDSDELFTQYAVDIRKGYAKNRQGVNVRPQFPGNEGSIPFGTNLMY